MVWSKKIDAQHLVPGRFLSGVRGLARELCREFARILREFPRIA